jgi:glycosyltransferase involved in cell wall biosynthesis
VRGLIRAARAIRAARRSIHADVVHCHGARSFAAARLVGPAYVTLHGVSEVSSDPRGYGRVRRAGLRVLPHLATRAFSVRPEVPPNWEFTPHASDRLAAMDRLGPPTAPTPTFLWIGRLDEPKRPDLFVRAMAALGTGRGLIAGSGPMAGDVARLIEATHAPVELLGHRGDITELLEQAWAVVMLSDHEA